MTSAHNAQQMERLGKATQEVNKMTNWETSDGWDLDNIYPLQGAVQGIEELESLAYELRNCCRTRSIVEMRDALKEAAQRIIDEADQIGDEDTVKDTTEEDE